MDPHFEHFKETSSWSLGFLAAVFAFWSDIAFAGVNLILDHKMRHKRNVVRSE